MEHILLAARQEHHLYILCHKQLQHCEYNFERHPSEERDQA
jgi:hypothetical protein